MCKLDDGVVVAAIAALAAAYPDLAREGSGHPALEGCEDVDWSAIPGCPEDVPLVLRGLLDPDAAEEAERVLGHIVMVGPVGISAAMPAVVPFLLRLAADPSTPRRTDLFSVVLVAAILSEPTDPDNAAALTFRGPEEEHPERARCRAAFAADAEWVSRLLADRELRTGTAFDDDGCVSLAMAAGL